MPDQTNPLRRRSGGGWVQDESLNLDVPAGFRDRSSKAIYREGTCARCGEHNRKLVLDHNHVTGRYRGFVCGTCNSRIGQLEHPYYKPDEALRTILYLEKHDPGNPMIALLRQAGALAPSTIEGSLAARDIETQRLMAQVGLDELQFEGRQLKQMRQQNKPRLLTRITHDSRDGWSKSPLSGRNGHPAPDGERWTVA